MNHVILIGNLTAAPELRSTGSGVSVCTFNIAVNRRFANQQGERETDFIPIVVWRTTAESCAKYLSKGNKVAVSGVLQTRRYEDKDGKKRTAFEVVAEDVEFLTPKAGSAVETPEGFTEEPDTNLPF